MSVRLNAYANMLVPEEIAMCLPDRIVIHCEMPQVDFRDLFGNAPNNRAADIPETIQYRSPDRKLLS